MQPLPACITQLVLLLVCAVMTVMTVALEEINITALRKDAEEDPAAGRMLRLKENESKLVAAYRFWSTLLFICVGLLSCQYLPEVYESAGALTVAAAILATALAAVVIGRLAPARIAGKNPEAVAGGMYWLLAVMRVISFPFVAAALWLAKIGAALFGVDPEEDLEELVELFDYDTPLWGGLLGTGDETPVYPFVFGAIALVSIAMLLADSRRRRRTSR